MDSSRSGPDGALGEDWLLSTGVEYLAQPGKSKYVFELRADPFSSWSTAGPLLGSFRGAGMCLKALQKVAGSDNLVFCR